MKKITAFALMAMMVLCLSTAPAFAGDLPKIMKKIIDAQGGRKVLESVKDIKSPGPKRDADIYIISIRSKMK